MLKKISEWLTLPEARGIDLDAPESTQLHAAIIRKKPFLKNIYLDFYREFERAGQDVPPGLWVELGSGGGFLKDVMPAVKTADVLFLPTLDVCFAGEKMPFKNDSVSAFFMLNVFHHIKDAFLFLQEVSRCLKPGGRVVLIEPANSFWGRFIYTHFHHEPFDPAGGWRLTKDGPLSSANGALPWIVFCRDRAKFARDFPSLVIKNERWHTPLLYLLSGGVSKRALVPARSYQFFKGLEFLLRPLARGFSMFMTIELQKQ